MRLLFAAIAMLIALPAQAQQWHRAETNNFIIISQDSEEATQSFASELERFDMALRSLQNLTIGEEQPSPSTKLTVYRFGDISDIGRMAGMQGVAGFYIPRAGSSVAYTPARRERRRTATVTNREQNRAQTNRLDEVSVLQHEYVHYFMMQHFPAAYPSWYVEGYAELLATLRFNDDGSFHVGDPPQYRNDQIFRMAQFPLEEMLDSRHELSRRDAYQFYGTGWLLTHYLNFNPERLALLNQYLAAIQQGEDSLTAARRIFGDLDAMDRELLRYRNGEFPGLSVRPANYFAPMVTMRALTPVETELVNSEMRLRRGVTKAEATRLARSIASGPDGATSHALALIAEAQAAAEDWDGALATADRLIALDPGNIEGPLTASSAASEKARQDPAFAARAVDYAAQAMAIDPLDPRPRIAYFYSFLASGREAPEEAILALEQVFDSAGTDPFYRVLLSRQLLYENRLPSAKAVLQPIAFRGHNQEIPGEADDEDEAEPSLDRIMAFIDAGNRDAALAMMDDMIDSSDEDDEG